MKKIFITVTLILTIFTNSLSWNIQGHQIIASIAYQNLTSATKQAIDEMSSVMFRSKSGYVRFLLASAWPDFIKGHDDHAFDHWHFINYPYAVDNAPTKPLARENVVWATLQSINVLKSPRADRFEKAWFLNFLVHFVGDVHQPLHCIILYSKKYPDGDRGGNLRAIRSDIADNLHAYWDKGAGLLSQRMRFNVIQSMADDIARAYPKSYFGKQLDDLQPATWAYESFKLAKQQVYQIEPETQPSSDYTTMAQTLIKKQLALAGYRLANLLNSICGEGGEGGGHCQADQY